jgi:MFS family permease
MILIAAFLDMVAMGIVMPVLPGLIEDLTGSLAGSAITVNGAGAAFTQSTAGAITSGTMCQ